MYTLTYDRRIEKDLRPLPKPQRLLILRRIEQLAMDPRPPQVEKLTDIEGYRLRVGNYRVLFTIEDPAKRLTIYRIRHRREAYR